MKTILKNLGITLLIFLAVSGIFALLSESVKNEKEIPLTQLVEEINNEKVKEIAVSGTDISVTYQDETQAFSVKEEDASLSQSLINYGVEKDKLKTVIIRTEKESSTWLWLGSILSLLPSLLLIGFIVWMMMGQNKAGSMQTFNFSRARARLFGADGQSKERVTFRDVAGLKEAKEELKEIVEFLKTPQKFLKIGAKIPRGVLLVGSPGTGKTLLARAVASEAGVPFFSIAGSEFVELFVGVGSSRVRDLFTTAKKVGTSIIFIDELDAIGRARGAGIGGGHDEREQTLNQILVEMDGFERDSTCIVMAATNRPDILDPALLRPGRFDRRVILEIPDLDDREEVLKIHCQGKPLDEKVDLREIAERTPGFSGADLANLVNEAAILAARRNKEKVFQIDLLESIEKVLLGPERRSHILSKKEKNIAAYHEAGHALISSFSPNAEPVRKVSIIARGRAAGYTLKVPSEEKKLRTKSEFLAELAVLLGGYCAEKITFGEVTTGAANDLEKASELARSLVKEYGMSSLGPISFGEKEELVFLGKEISEQRNYSESIAAMIDKEVEKFIKDAEKTAEKLLEEKKILLEKLAGTLVEKETIEREEYEDLVFERGHVA